TRDRLMVEWDRQFPGYGLARNKGYGTCEHLVALQRLGPCPIHRKTFAPVRVAGFTGPTTPWLRSPQLRPPPLPFEPKC
ncbi:MAG: hypothetical protein V3V32_03540, partial [Dehalococcoidia bacterium]